MAKFQKGNAGKPKGATNKITKTVKEVVLAAFQELQEDSKANIITWGKKNPHLFYPIAAKLIPTEVNAHVEGKIITVSTIAPKKQLPSKTGTLTDGKS